MALIRQTGFSGGEIAPEYRSRTDHPRYNTALAKAENFIITPQGSALNRPGTKYIQATRNGSAARLVPYVYNELESYVLEFTNQAIRFYKNGEPIMDGLNPYTLTSGVAYLTDHLFQLKFAQVGADLYITHWGYTPKMLTRTTDTSWALSNIDPSIRPYFNVRSNGRRPSLDSSTFPTADATHPAREWVWVATTVLQEIATGLVFESQALAVINSIDLAAGSPNYAETALPSNDWAVYADKPVTISWPETASSPYVPSGYADYSPLAWRIYRGRGDANKGGHAGVFGFLGETTSRKFVDTGAEPDWSIQPPLLGWPMTVRDNGGNVTRTEEPACIGFFEQRLVLGGTDERPTSLWFSKTDDYLNFDVSIYGIQDGAVEFDLASMRHEEVRSLVGLDRLWVFTSGGVWTVAGSGGPLALDSIQAIKQTDESASWVSPLIVGDTLLYIRDKGNTVNEIGYEDARGKASTVNLSLFSPHLLDRKWIEDWAFATDPYRIAWMVRNDGVLLSMTYDRRQETVAWASHTTDGTFESVCVVPEQEEDAVYFVVNRTINGTPTRYVERMYTRRLVSQTVFDGDSSNPVFLDCVKMGAGLASKTITGLTHLEGESIYVLVDGNVHGPLTVVSGNVTLNLGDTPTASVWQAGLIYTPELETLDVPSGKTEIRGKQMLVTSANLEVVASRGFQVGETTANLTEWRQRQVADSSGAVPLYTGIVKVAINSTWNTGGKIVVRQNSPLPLAIHGLIREVNLGGD